MANTMLAEAELQRGPTSPGGDVFLSPNTYGQEGGTDLTEGLCLADCTSVRQFWKNRSTVVDEALSTLGRIQDLDGRLLTLTAISESSKQTASVDRVSEVRGRLQDQGTVWRRATDDLSIQLATRFPSSVLSRHSSGDTLFTDNHKLFMVSAEGTVTAFYSLLSQAELNSGIVTAGTESWLRVLWWGKFARLNFPANATGQIAVSNTLRIEV